MAKENDSENAWFDSADDEPMIVYTDPTGKTHRQPLAHWAEYERENHLI